MRNWVLNRRLAILLVGLFLLGVVSAMSYAATQPVQTVESVNLERYMGKWYEIAAIPMFFERKCIGNTTAIYSLLPDGLVKVTNSCDVAKGKRMMAEGRGRVMDAKTHAKLKVTFWHFLGWRWIVGGDYWIIDLAPDYSYAIVGHPSRKYGWILSRVPVLPKETLQRLATHLKAQGYNACNFSMIPQKGGLNTRQPLCRVVGGS